MNSRGSWWRVGLYWCPPKYRGGTGIDQPDQSGPNQRQILLTGKSVEKMKLDKNWLIYLRWLPFQPKHPFISQRCFSFGCNINFDVISDVGSDVRSHVRSEVGPNVGSDLDQMFDPLSCGISMTWNDFRKVSFHHLCWRCLGIRKLRDHYWCSCPVFTLS